MGHRRSALDGKASTGSRRRKPTDPSFESLGIGSDLDGSAAISLRFPPGEGRSRRRSGWSASARPREGPVVAGIVWTPARLRGLRHGLWVGAALQLVYCVAGFGHGGVLGIDAHAYWAAWRNGLYTAGPEQQDAYLYSPFFAQVLWPLTLLPWPVFGVLWTLATVAAFAWLLAPLGWRWAPPLLLLCLPEILSGNVWALFALVLALGFRYPAAWAFPVLLKVTPGVGIVWFGARREWRSAAVATVTAGGIALVSFVLAPHLWGEWLRLLTHPEAFHNPARQDLQPALHLPAQVRVALGVPLAVALTVHAARRDRPRLLPAAMLLALPVLAMNAFTLLAAIPRMAATSSDER